MTAKKTKLGLEFVKSMNQLAISAFGLVAALAWNDAIKSILDRFIQPGAGIISKLIYALIVTALALIITINLGKILQKTTDIEENKDSKGN